MLVWLILALPDVAAQAGADDVSFFCTLRRLPELALPSVINVLLFSVFLRLRG